MNLTVLKAMPLKPILNGFDNLLICVLVQHFQRKKDSLVPLSNVAYVLDSISSFRQNLVKENCGL
jgi:type III restriction enzyme